MIDYDKRQLRIMIDKIEQFQKGNLYLSYLIEDLEALLNVLQNIDNEWKINFRTEWWDLEQVYAYALYENQAHLDDEGVKMVNETIDNILGLINEILTKEE